MIMPAGHAAAYRPAFCFAPLLRPNTRPPASRPTSRPPVVQHAFPSPGLAPHRHLHRLQYAFSSHMLRCLKPPIQRCFLTTPDWCSSDFAEISSLPISWWTELGTSRSATLGSHPTTGLRRARERPPTWHQSSLMGAPTTRRCVLQWVPWARQQGYPHTCWPGLGMWYELTYMLLPFAWPGGCICIWRNAERDAGQAAAICRHGRGRDPKHGAERWPA